MIDSQVISSDVAMYKKTYRTKIDDAALNILQRSYWSDPKPSSQEKEHLAVRTRLSYKTVSIWFQNQRSKRVPYYGSPLKIERQPYHIAEPYPQRARPVQTSDSSGSYFLNPAPYTSREPHGTTYGRSYIMSINAILNH